MSTITDATEMPRRIWIEPECCAGGDVTEQRWAEDDIFDCDEGARATEYVRADLVAEMLEAKRWLVFNIGCIECGVSSNVVGVYATEKEAEAVADACWQELDWREGGQNSFEVFDLNAAQAEEYRAAIAKAEGKE